MAGRKSMKNLMAHKQHASGENPKIPHKYEPKHTRITKNPHKENWNSKLSCNDEGMCTIKKSKTHSEHKK